ncbi:MAG TPA: hypothetical protein VK698_00910 [Kofleriaceae bacterium]|nr:hypothetical protein [Kofleriaceae bacterium]
MTSATTAPARRPSRPLAAIAVGGLIAGVLDITSAIVAYLPDGVSPVQIMQSVARGALGKSAFEGGWRTALIGLGFHFLIAFTAAAVYYLASRELRFLTRRPYLSAFLYGEAVFLFMRLVVMPLSTIGFHMPKLDWQNCLAGWGGHIFLVGLPIALATRHFAPHRDDAAPAAPPSRSASVRAP